MSAPLVGIVMGSDSDWEQMKGAVKALKDLGVACEVDVMSAHRTPDKAHEYAASAESRGLQVIIAGAGGAAHLAGVMAACTALPVIGVPLDSGKNLAGVDALYATVQMPPGVPVASMGIGEWGAINAGLFAAQIVARTDAGARERFIAYKAAMPDKVAAKAEKVHQKFDELMAE